MLNLLPPDAKAELYQEYRARFLVLALVFLSSAVLVASVSALPYALSTLSEYLAVRRQPPPEIYTLTDADQELTLRFKNFKEALALLDPKKIKEKSLFVDVMRVIVFGKPDSISLQSFSLVADNPAVGKRIVVSGVAADRESLLVFSGKLSENPLFASVDLPVSNLSKKSDIDFSITVSLPKPK